MDDRRDPRIPEPEPSLVMAHELGRVITAEPLLRRELRAGRLVRLRRGVYMPSAAWESRGPDARYRALVRATALLQPTSPVMSHQSAAALWGLPVIGPWPAVVHVLIDRATGGRSDPGIRRHALGIDPDHVETIDGVHVTILARTVIEVAATSTLHSAVATADAALHIPRNGTARLTRAELIEMWQSMLPFRGSRRAREVIEFAESGSDSPMESASRVTIALAGFPRPELQRRFVVEGREFFADFYWEEIDCIGECDGFGKYSNPTMLRGRTVTQAVLDEKRREDLLRSRVSRFVRWEGRDALDSAVIARRLTGAGLRPSIRSRTLRGS